MALPAFLCVSCAPTSEVKKKKIKAASLSPYVMLCLFSIYVISASGTGNYSNNTNKTATWIAVHGYRLVIFMLKLTFCISLQYN